MEHSIIISVEEYRDLVAKAERIAAVERMVTKGDYVSTGAIMAVLDIPYEQKGAKEL